MNIITQLEANLMHFMPRIKMVKQSRTLPFCTLDLSYDVIDEIKGLKTRLFQHQKTAIKAMIDLENNRKLNLGDYSIEFNMGFLTEPVGSGKSIDILGLILANNVVYINNIVCYNSRHCPPHIEIKKFDLPKVKTNIIIMNNTVIRQWEKTITDFTDLKYFTIENLVTLREFLTFSIEKINTYDIILVKHGKTNGDLIYNDKRYKDVYIYEMVCIRNIIWQRFIVDDFDSIKLNCNFQNFKANFSWFISSTKRKVSDISYSPNMSYEEIHNFNNYAKFIIRNKFLYDVVNVKSDTEYLKKSLDLPSINFYLARIENKNNIFLDMLSAEYEYDDKIVELMNGDSIKKISSILSIEANSIHDVFEHIIGNKFYIFNKACEIIDFINNIKESVIETNETYNYSKTDLSNKIMPKFLNKKISKILTETWEDNINIKNDIQKQIERLKSHINHNTCPVCYGDLNTEECEECVILKCCNHILCFRCALASFNVKQISDLSEIFSCPMCRKNIEIQDVIYLGKKLEIFNEIKNCKEITKIENPKIKKEVSNKFESIIKLFNNELFGEKVNIKMNNILKGTLETEMPNYKKIIIFASDFDILYQAKNILDENHIKNWRLFGNTKEIAATAKLFTEFEGNCAILVNSENYCSGLNLQTATDILFLHNILNIHIEEQTIGRGYRIGRKYPLNVWYFQYNNEYNRMRKTHNISFE